MRYRFGPFELDAEQYELREGSRVVHVEPRVLDVLFFLVRNRDRVVSKEEILDSVWEAKFIGDSALSRCIMQARKAIGAGFPGEEAIKTLRRRGFRFVAPVTEENLGNVARIDTRVAPDAGKLLARARVLWMKRTPEDVRNAIVLLQQAIEIEPAYAAAFAALGDCYNYLGYLQLTAPRSAFPKAEAAFARATALDPTLAEVHASRGFTQLVYGWNPAAAEEAFAEAIRLDSGLATAHHWRGLFLLSQRKFAEADRALRHASVLAPLSAIFATAVGLPAMFSGDEEEAIRIFRSIIVSEPSFIPVHFYLGLALERSGRIEEAIDAFRTASAMGNLETEALPALAHALSKAGRTAEAAQIVERLTAASQQRFISPFFFAVAAMGEGDAEGALRWLEEATAIRANRMYELHLDHRFVPLRDDARFIDILSRVGCDPITESTSSHQV
jgi:DNA-binding winged helix-turn-helix (wHTH) protein/tetratricopeptide (TPR) repeat protein